MLQKQFAIHKFSRRVIPSLLICSSCVVLSNTDSQARPRRVPIERAPLKRPAPKAIPAPLQIDPAARVALARARQLAAAQAEELAATEYERAAALAPHWLEAQRELAIWQASHEQWEPAAIAWSRVLTLLRDKRGKEYQEAAFALERTKANLPPGWKPPLPTPPKTPIKPAAPVKPAAVKPLKIKPPHVAANKPPRLTQAPPDKAPTITNPSGVVPQATTPTPRPNAPAMPRVKQTFPLGSVPSLKPKIATVAPAVAPRVAVAPRATTKLIGRKGRGKQRAIKKPAGADSLMKRAAAALRSRQYETGLKLYQKALALNPKNQQAQAGVTQSLLLLKRYDVVEATVRRALKARPEDITALHKLAAVLMLRKDTPGALRVYQQILTINPNDFTAAYQTARILTWTRRHDASEPYYRQALALQPANPEVWAAWGEALTLTNDTRGRGAFERALQLRPGYKRARLGLANLFMANGDYENALDTFKSVLAAEPRNAAAAVGIGDVMTYSNQEAAAMPYYQTALRIAPRSLPARLGLSRALIYTQQYAAGIPHLQSVLKAAPDNEEAVQLLAFARSNASARGEVEAIAAYRSLLKNQPELSHQAVSWAAIGQLKARLGDLAGAREAYAVARRMAPGDNAITLAYAQSFLYQDQWSQAAALVDDVLRREPENIHALILQFVIVSRSGKAERAATLAIQLVAVASQDATSLPDSAQAARALRQAGRQEAAREVLERLAAKSATDAAMIVQIADAARALGDNQSALRFYQRVLARDAAHSEARFKMAETQIEDKQYEGAQQTIAMELLRDKNNPRARLLSARGALRSQSDQGWETAKKRADELLLAFPQDAAVHVLAGDVMSARDFHGAALDYYRTAFTLAPANLQAQLGLARSLYALRRPDAALEQYRELLRRAPGDTRLKLECARLYLEQDNPVEAGLLFNQVLAMSRSFLPPRGAQLEPVAARKYALEVAARSNARIDSWSPDSWSPDSWSSDSWSTAFGGPLPDSASPLIEQVLALRGMGEIRGRQRRFKDAANYFQRALQLQPTDATTRLGLAQALRGGGDLSAAQAATEAVLSADSGNIIARALRAQLLLDSGKVAEAEIELNNLITNLPAQPPLENYLTLHQSFSDWRNFSAALRFVEMARKTYPKKPELARLTGQTLMADNQWEKALEAFDQALAANPRDIATLLAKARIYAATHRLTPAESLYRRVLSEQKDNDAALAGLAAVLARRGDWTGALDIYRAAVRQNPRDLNMRDNLARALRYRLLAPSAAAQYNLHDLTELVELLRAGGNTQRRNISSVAGLDLWFLNSSFSW